MTKAVHDETPLDEGGDVAYDVVDTGDDHVHTHIDEGGGAFQVTENRAVTKYNEGGGVHDCVFDEHDHVDDEAEFTKEIGPAACSRSVMRDLFFISMNFHARPTLAVICTVRVG